MPIHAALTVEQKFEVLSVDTRDYIAKSNDFEEWMGPPDTTFRRSINNLGISKFLYHMSHQAIDAQTVLDAEDDPVKKKEMLDRAERIIFAGQLNTRWYELASEWPGGRGNFEMRRWKE